MKLSMRIPPQGQSIKATGIPISFWSFTAKKNATDETLSELASMSAQSFHRPLISSITAPATTRLT